MKHRLKRSSDPEPEVDIGLHPGLMGNSRLVLVHGNIRRQTDDMS